MRRKALFDNRLGIASDAEQLHRERAVKGVRGMGVVGTAATTS
jgi:hypothetical protein